MHFFHKQVVEILNKMGTSRQITFKCPGSEVQQYGEFEEQEQED